METLLPIIVQVITGVIGGQAVGAALKNAAMGQLPKILSGEISLTAHGPPRSRRPRRHLLVCTIASPEFRPIH